MDPKLFDAFNVPLPASELAENMLAAVRTWDRPYKDAVRYGDDLNRLARTTTLATWESLSPLLPVPTNWPCTDFAREIFQILKIWGLTHKQAVEFCGRFKAIVEEKGPKGWNDWKPDIRPNFTLPGVSRPL